MKYTKAGRKKWAIGIGWQSVATFAVDLSGDVYVARYPFSLVKLAPNGRTRWVRRVSKQITAVFGHQTRHGFVIGAVMGAAGTHRFGVGGKSLGHSVVTGQNFSDGPGHTLIAATGSSVVKYGRNWKRSYVFGAAGSANDPPPGQFAFYQQGSALELRGGGYLVADSTRGIESFTKQGILRGIAPETAVGGLTQEPAMARIGGRLYYATGARFTADQQVSSLPLAAVLRKIRPSATSGLGIGVGVALPTGAYFAAGRKPHGRLRFNPWWRQVSHLTLRYTVQRMTGEEPSPPASAHRLALTRAKLRSGVRLQLPPGKPGPYELNLRLRRKGHVIGATTVNYSVGAPGIRFHLNRLPGSADSGGPDGARGVALADVLGTGAHRVALSWAQLIGPAGNLNFSYYDPIIRAAARESAKTGVPFSVLLADGSALPYIRNGTWVAKVAQIVAHWKSEVRYWEPYNEPNATFGSAVDYVNQVLKPAYRAIKTVEPRAKVIGGTVVGYDLSYWQQIAAAGGFHYMDIAGIHPYTGYNRSFEEQDFAAYIHQLRALFARHGRPKMSIWITELAWWSTGVVNVTGQADKSARAILWMKALGISHWEYFISQGSWTDGGQDFSAIENSSWVKPAALALMAAKSALHGRKVRGFRHTGIPHAYDLSFAARRPSSESVQALWTDDLKIRAVLRSTKSTTVHVVDEYGQRSRISLVRGKATPLPLSGSVQYLFVPPHTQVTVRPAERTGRDVALASAGATATASSTNPASSPAGAIDGDYTTDEGVGFPSGPAWVSAPGDRKPTLTVHLPHAERVDRVLLATTGIGSVLTGVRSYDIAVRNHHRWSTVGRVRGNFFSRMVLTTFAPRRVTAVRIHVLKVNYSGYGNGSRPAFWPHDKAALRDPNQTWYGPAVIRELAIYRPGAHHSRRKH